MNLVEVKPEYKRAISTESAVKIYKSGLFQFTKLCQEKLHMKGKRASFFQDKDDPGNWYLEISVEGSLDIRIYESGEKSKGPVITCSSIAKRIKISTKNNPEDSIKALIGNAMKYKDTIVYPLLIQNGDYRGQVTSL